MNHVNLIGKIASQPKVYETPNGRRIAQFTMSTNEVYLDDSGNSRKKSNWHRVAAWGKWVTILEELGTVGMELAVEGKLRSRYYEENGKKQFTAEVEVNDLIIL